MNGWLWLLLGIFVFSWIADWANSREEKAVEKAAAAKRRKRKP